MNETTNNDLLTAARSVPLPFESSPTGRWVRFRGGKHTVYVVGDPWGDGCSVLADDARVGHFRRPQEAVSTAVQLITAGAA